MSRTVPALTQWILGIHSAIDYLERTVAIRSTEGPQPCEASVSPAEKSIVARADRRKDRARGFLAIALVLATAGDDDVESEQPWWGIRSPLEPWSGPGNIAQNAATGVIRSHGVGHREIARREDSRNLGDLRPRRLSLRPPAKGNRAPTRGFRSIL
jgi:hypothetical protein